MNHDQLTNPFGDTTVDNLQDAPVGVIDHVSTLNFDVPDNTIIKNLERRIADSQDYWNRPAGFNLKQVRYDNIRMYLGKHLDQNKLYRYQTPYVENQVYVGEEAIIAYLTAQNPAPEVYPSQDTPRSRIFAQDLEKAMKSHSDMFHFSELMAGAVRNVLNKRIGIVKLSYDPDFGPNGEIIPSVIDPEHLVVDKNAKQSDNPAFICEMLKMSVNEMISRWPSKKEKIFQELGIVRGTAKQLEEIIQVREVWVTYYNSKFEACEGCVYYFGNVVLEKVKNPNWLYASANKNFASMPTKPYIPLNFDNDGSHWIDYTGPVEQAGVLQDVLNKRGRQLMEVVDKANGTTVFSSDSGLSKDDVQNLTGDPNQRLIIKTNGQRVDDLVHRIDPPVIPPMLMQDKVDLRTQIHAILGTPSEFTGSPDGNDDDPTLGQSQMKKNQASGRQDLFVRAIDRFLTRYFNYWVQMAVVWYDAKHMFVYNGGDGEFDYITMSRDLIEDGVIVSVKSGSTPPFDKGRQEAIGLKLGEMKAISPLDLFKLLNLPNSQQLYDNWAKFTANPAELARSSMDEQDNNKAYIAYTEIMNGEKPKDPDDADKEYVLSLRKLMLTDEFLRAPRNRQGVFLKFVEKAVNSLALRTSLDQMSDEGGVMALDPKNPIPPPQPPQQPGMPPAASGGPMPPQPPMGSGGPPPPGPMPPSPLGGMPLPPGGAPVPPMGGVPPINAPPQLGQIAPQPGLPPIQ